MTRVNTKKISKVEIIFSVFVVVLLFFVTHSEFTFAQVDSDSPPVIDNIKIIQIGTDSFTAQWETDEEADSIVHYGLNSKYGLVRDPLPDKTLHQIVVDSLDPSTAYHFRVVSSDEFGNQSLSSDFVVKTAGLEDIEGIEDVSEIEQQALVEQAFTILEKITDEEAVALIQEKLQTVAEGVTDDLRIIGTPDVDVETNSAVISWITDRPSNSQVNFVSDDDFNPLSTNPYFFSQFVDDNVIEHSLEIIGLEAFTKYHFQVQSEDRLGIIGKSNDLEFTTKALLPNIFDLDFLKIEETAATLVWRTTVPSSALVEYENLTTGVQKSLGNPALSTGHQLRIADLTLGTRYRVKVIAENAGGDRVESDPFTFVTIKDEEPPIISKVTNESTLFPGSENRIQTIISWETDEPSLCDFFFRQGIAPGIEPSTFPRQEDNLIEKHVQVVVDFTPSTVYQFWVECADSSENGARSEDFVLFTPEKEKSIIDIILENFEGTFGWVKNIGK